jgi:hypothetical protein
MTPRSFGISFRFRVAIVLVMTAVPTLVSSCGSAVAADDNLPPPVASVTVTIDSTAISLDGVAQAVAVAKDKYGKVIEGQVFSWQPADPAMIMVSDLGGITPIRGGLATVQASAGGKTGKATLTVRKPAPPDLLSQDFEDGTIGKFDKWGSNESFEVVGDPTGSGRGSVVKLHYKGNDGDDNTSLVYGPRIGFGKNLFFRGEFYISAADLGGYGVQRKLIYFKSHEDWGKYNGARKFRTFVKLTGDELGVDAVYEPDTGNLDKVRTFDAIAKGLKPQTWYTLEVQQTTESALGAGDGVLKVWLDGILKFSKTNMRWTDPDWVGKKVPGGETVLDESDLYWDTFMVGQQVNVFGASFDEYRYWNNIAFSTQRIGP